MMYGCGKSDEAIVAGKPANKAERSAAELVERRAEAKGNVGQQRTLWTQCQEARVTGAGPHTHHRLRDGASEPEVGEAMGRAAAVVAPSSSIRTDGGYPWPKSMISAEA